MLQKWLEPEAEPAVLMLAVEQVVPALVAEPKLAVEQVEPELEVEPKPVAEQVEPELEVEPKPEDGLPELVAVPV